MTHDQHTGSRRVDVAVVGGGLAGLAAAAFAARAGATVTLLDGRAVGGRARSADREGFVVNEGAPGVTVHPRADERHITPADVCAIAAELRPYRGRVE